MHLMTATGLIHLFLGPGSLVLLSKITTSFACRAIVPAVLLEILLGIMAGPTVLGTLLPAWSEWFFPVAGEVGAVLKQLSQVAVLMLLFVAGLETDLKVLRTETGKVAVTALGSFLVPFAAGFLLVFFNPELFGVAADRHGYLASFLGIALAISALPVIIRILIDLGIYQSRIGVITVAAASLMDILGWTAFTVLLYVLNPFPIQDAAKMLWSHSTLLSFFIGIMLGNAPFLPEKLKRWAYQFVILVMSPLFFLSVGARINFAANWEFAMIGMVILVATASKLLGTFMGGRYGRLGVRDALAVGFALNVRGAMEIILSKHALEVGLIEPNLYVALVVMALFTILLGSPAIKFLVLKPTSENYSPERNREGIAILPEKCFAFLGLRLAIPSLPKN
jgi:Kef-type K+ transport system membrane component KefB